MRFGSAVRVIAVAVVGGSLLITVKDSEKNDSDADTVRLPVTRDTRFSSVGSEASCNFGGAPRLKLKSYQEMSLIDVDAAPLKGRALKAATLYLRSPGEPTLARVTVGSFGAEWVEGTSTEYKPQPGSSCYSWRQFPNVPWTIAGSDLCSVMLGQGGTTWRSADASQPNESGWQKVAVDPSVLAARTAGISHGLLLFDDTGTEWTRRGEQFRTRSFPNRFVYSKDADRASAPYLIAELGEVDREPPAAPSDLRADRSDLPAGEAWLSWKTPFDRGPAGTLGFFVTVNGKEVPRYLIPLAAKPGEPVRMHLRDLGLKAGERVQIAVRAVDAAGNISEPTQASTTVSALAASPLPGESPPVAKTSSQQDVPLPMLGQAHVAIIDELDKVSPLNGKMIPQRSPAYLRNNHLWNAAKRQITIFAARNEFVSFQILFRGAVAGVQPELVFTDDALKGVFGRYANVNGPGGPLPDPVIPLAGPFSVPTPEEHLAAQTAGSLHVDLYVPHDVAVGAHAGTLRLRSGQDRLEIAVKLHIWDFTLPDYLSFIPEMNCYGLPPEERDYYRLAHRHRVVLNSLPYYQNGIIHPGCAPTWSRGSLNWRAWDARFGPYFDGSAFADLPRKGVPLECFYLPLHENWPDPIKDNYNGDYWADRAFTKQYRDDFVRASRLFAEHFDKKGWHDTLFQGFLNNKNIYKERGWSRATSPWLLDEPAHLQDFWALHYFGAAFHEGIHQAAGKAKMVFRVDVSRPMWQRDLLDDVLDYNVVGGEMRRYRRMVLDRKEANRQIAIEYGSTNAIDASNVQPLFWSIDTWTLGCDGVLPWQTLGTADSWKHADSLALIYPPRGGRHGEPIPSVRLKAYRRGQQDAEYLTLLQLATRQPRWAVAQEVRAAIGLRGVRSGISNADDPGAVGYGRMLPEDAWKLRYRIGSALSARHPEPKRRLVTWQTVDRIAREVIAVGIQKQD
jgi:hypothetical protein